MDDIEQYKNDEWQARDKLYEVVGEVLKHGPFTG
jgi:hypothetical protein